ncbi:MFS transporter, partial [Streptomyces sp. A7024]
MTESVPVPASVSTTPTSEFSKADGTDNAPASPPRTRPGWLLAIVLTGQFMALLDVFIVNVAAPTIRTELHAGGAELQLIIAGYTITYAVLLITGARLGGILGHRRIFLVGLAVFTAASLACGLAAGAGQLIAFRLVQGAGSALFIPQVLSLIQRTFTGPSRVRALGWYSAVLATGAAAGQIVGGLLVSADLFGAGWRPVFLVNVPIGLALLALGLRLLPHDEAAPGAFGRAVRALDRGGLVLLAAVVSLFTVPLVLGQELGWPLWGWLSLAASGLLAVFFYVHEARLGRRGGAPLFPPQVLRAGRMPVAVIRTGLALAINGGFLLVITLHVQGGLGYSALRSGLTLVPAAIGFGITGLTWQRLPARLQPLTVPFGFALAAVSSVAMGAVLRDGGEGGAALYVALAGVGAGLGYAFSPNLTLALATVRQEDAPHASGLMVTTAQLGITVGVATIGTLYLNQLDGPGAAASGDALWVAALAQAGAALA